MLESLDINGRHYVPVDRAEHETGYARSYIERLARDKWIDASFVQGECFVDVNSFNTFIATAQSDVYTQLRKVAQREQAEQAYQQYLMAQEQLLESRNEVLIFGKLGVVVLCGLLVGALSLTFVGAGMTPADIESGMSQVASLLTERMMPASVIEWFLHGL